MYYIWPATAVEGNGHHQRERSWYSLSLGRISHVHEFLGWYRKIDGWFWIGRSVWRDLRILWNIYSLEKLTQSALISHLLSSIANGELDLSELEKTYQTMETGMTEDDSMELSTKQIMKDLAERMAVTRNENIKSHTAKLWLLYVQYISIVKEYILSERTCNWSLHLHTVQKMMISLLFLDISTMLSVPDLMPKKFWHCQMKSYGYNNSLLMENMQYDVLAATGLVCSQTWWSNKL